MYNHKNRSNLFHKKNSVNNNKKIKPKKRNNLLKQNILKNNQRKNSTNSANEITKLNEQKLIRRIKNIMKYTDEENNLLPYELAIKYDKRNYCSYYISLLKTKHNFIFLLFRAMIIIPK